MLQLLIYSMTLITSLTFIQMSHPLAMGLILLGQTVLISLITGFMAKTFWFSYTLFLIFLGGMLVLFIYVTSLASNEMFSLSSKLTTIALILMMATTAIILTMDKTILYPLIQNNEMTPMYDLTSFIKENSLNLIKLYNYPNNMITIILINYLLISLVAIVKITNVFHGPLRPMK